MDYISHDVNSTYNKLRKMIKQHANTFVTRYKWCQELTLEQAESKYAQEISKKIPDVWIIAFDEANFKVFKKYEIYHPFNLISEARILFIKCWDELDVRPKWLGVRKANAKAKN